MGGTARVRVGGLLGPLAKAELALSEAPAGIAITKVLPTDKGTEIVLQSDAAKTTAGLKGNLIVTASVKRAALRRKEKRRRTNVR